MKRTGGLLTGLVGGLIGRFKRWAYTHLTQYERDDKGNKTDGIELDGGMGAAVNWMLYPKQFIVAFIKNPAIIVVAVVVIVGTLGAMGIDLGALISGGLFGA